MAMDAVVVAGGTSRRFGSDKVVVARDGTRQVEVVVAALRALGGRIILARGARSLDVDDTIEVADAAGLEGPLAGIVAGLQVATTPLVAIVAADLVTPSRVLLQALGAHVTDRGIAGAMPSDDGVAQPLHAVVRADLVDELARAGSDVGVIAAFRTLDVATVDEATWQAWAPDARPGRDIDVLADLPADLPDTAAACGDGPTGPG